MHKELTLLGHLDSEFLIRLRAKPINKESGVPKGQEGLTPYLPTRYR